MKPERGTDDDNLFFPGSSRKRGWLRATVPGKQDVPAFFPATRKDHPDEDHCDGETSPDWLWHVRKARLISWSNRTRDPFS